MGDGDQELGLAPSRSFVVGDQMIGMELAVRGGAKVSGFAHPVKRAGRFLRQSPTWWPIPGKRRGGLLRSMNTKQKQSRSEP
jgi:hypothetical protein